MDEVPLYNSENALGRFTRKPLAHTLMIVYRALGHATVSITVSRVCPRSMFSKTFDDSAFYD